MALFAFTAFPDSEVRVFRPVYGSHSVAIITYVTSKKPDTTVFFEARGLVYDVQYNGMTGIVGIMSRIPGVVSDAMRGRYSVLPRNILQIVDSSANLLIEKDIEIGTYDISPDGMSIVFLSGPVHPEGDLSFHPKRMGLIDISTGKINWLLDSLLVTKNEMGVDVHWAGTGIVYLITGRTMFVVDTNSGELNSTGLEGSSDISPDGIYQLVGTRFPSARRPVRLFHIPTGTDETKLLYQTEEEIFTITGYLSDIGWLENFGSVVYVGLTPKNMGSEVTGLKLKKLTSFIIHLPTGKVVMRDDSGKSFFVRESAGYLLLDDSTKKRLEELNVSIGNGKQ